MVHDCVGCSDYSILLGNFKSACVHNNTLVLAFANELANNAMKHPLFFIISCEGFKIKLNNRLSLIDMETRKNFWKLNM